MPNPNPSYKFPEGVSGNPNGRPKKGTTLTELMEKYLEDSEPEHKVTRKEEFIAKVATMAYKGDLQAIKLIWNYLDGMPKQSVELQGSKSIKVDFIDADTTKD
jgi:hypothetical protein